MYGGCSGFEKIMSTYGCSGLKKSWADMVDS
jgi:hypothetical protein